MTRGFLTAALPPTSLFSAVTPASPPPLPRPVQTLPQTHGQFPRRVPVPVPAFPRWQPRCGRTQPRPGRVPLGGAGLPSNPSRGSSATRSSPFAWLQLRSGDQFAFLGTDVNRDPAQRLEMKRKKFAELRSPVFPVPHSPNLLPKASSASMNREKTAQRGIARSPPGCALPLSGRS